VSSTSGLSLARTPGLALGRSLRDLFGNRLLSLRLFNHRLRCWRVQGLQIPRGITLKLNNVAGPTDQTADQATLLYLVSSHALDQGVGMPTKSVVKPEA